jgi:hypothetical protein
MKQYQLLFHPEHGYRVVSTNALDYSDYIMTGWEEKFTGNKKQCESQLDEMESTGALAD